MKLSKIQLLAKFGIILLFISFIPVSPTSGSTSPDYPTIEEAKFSKNNVSIGENFSVQVSFTNNSKIHQVYGDISNSIYSLITGSFSYNSTSNYFEADFTITENWDPGEYSIYSIRYELNYGDYASYDYDKDELPKNSMYIFGTNGVNIEAISTNSTELTPNSTAHIKLDLTGDIEKDLTWAYINFAQIDRENTILPKFVNNFKADLSYNSTSEKLEAYVTISPYSASSDEVIISSLGYKVNGIERHKALVENGYKDFPVFRITDVVDFELDYVKYNVTKATVGDGIKVGVNFTKVMDNISSVIGIITQDNYERFYDYKSYYNETSELFEMEFEVTRFWIQHPTRLTILDINFHNYPHITRYVNTTSFGAIKTYNTSSAIIDNVSYNASNLFPGETVKIKAEINNTNKLTNVSASVFQIDDEVSSPLPQVKVFDPIKLVNDSNIGIYYGEFTIPKNLSGKLYLGGLELDYGPEFDQFHLNNIHFQVDDIRILNKVDVLNLKISPNSGMSAVGEEVIFKVELFDNSSRVVNVDLITYIMGTNREDKFEFNLTVTAYSSKIVEVPVIFEKAGNYTINIAINDEHVLLNETVLWNVYQQVSISNTTSSTNQTVPSSPLDPLTTNPMLLHGYIFYSTIITLLPLLIIKKRKVH